MKNLIRMKTALLTVAALLMFAIPAQADDPVMLGFVNITNNNPGDAAIGEAQLFVEVSDPGGDQVLFTFYNVGTEDSSIADVYFDDGSLLGIASIDDSHPGVSFSQGANPADLPGGNGISPPFEVTEGFSADSDPPAQPNGVNPGEWLGILFDLQDGKTFADVLDDLATGALRIGIHVQGFASGGSESFINHPPGAGDTGTITIIKDADPADGEDFAFSGDLGAFTLDDADPDDGDGIADAMTFTDLATGPYDVSESVPSGWDLVDIQCVDPDQGTQVSVGEATASIDLDAGEHIYCTFENVLQRGEIIVEKVTDPSGDPTEFDFALMGGPSELDEAFSLSDGESYSSGPVLPGSGYSAAETVPDGWDLTSATCDDGSPVTDIDVSPGETVVCTFENTGYVGMLGIRKVTDPSGDPTEFDFTLTGGLAPNDFSLSDGDGIAFGLVPGSGYSVAETVPDGWDLTSATCDDGSPVTDIDVSPGETVVCTFENTAQPGEIVVEKVTDPSGDPTEFDFALTGGPSELDEAFSLSDGDSYSSGPVLPGSNYSAAETVPDGWDLTSATCDDGSPVTDIDVSPGETVVCTFENTLRGEIVIEKVTDPSGDPTEFDFALTGGPSELDEAFSLSDGESYSSGPVLPGSNYSAAETVPDGWNLVSATCDDGSPVTDIDVSPGETVICTFLNEEEEEPTAVTLAAFSAEAGAGSVVLAWETAAEIDNAGFNLYRATAEGGPYTKVNDALVAAEGDPTSGASYTFLDKGLLPGTYYYKLEDVDFAGVTALHGPVSATVVSRLRRPSYRPMAP